MPVLEAGAVKSVLMFADEITERKQMEEALRESEERFRSLAESSQDYIMLYDKGCRHLYENPAALKVAGFTEEDIIGKTHREVGFDEELCDLWEEKITAVFGTGGPSQTVFEWGGAEGVVHLDWRLAPVLDKDGEIGAVLGISRDITECKRAEEQVKANLAEKEALLREIHHRVKNNLQVISSLLKLQSDALESEEAAHAFQESRNRVHAMARVHEHLYRSEDLARIDMANYIRGLVSYLRQLYRAYRVIHKVEVGDVVLGLDTATPCGLLINELVSNAMKHAFPTQGEAGPDAPRGEILVALRAEDDELSLTVSDNGVGLPEDVDLQTTQSLGLRLAGMLTRQLQGTLEVDRERGKGTAFKVTFPAPT